MIYQLSETEWLRQVIQMARTFRWKVAHFRPAQNSKGYWRTAVSGDGKGFPDLVLAHESGDVLFVELKSDKGKLEPDQEAWAKILGARFDLWRPRDFDRVRARLMEHHTGPRRGDDAPSSVPGKPHPPKESD